MSSGFSLSIFKQAPLTSWRWKSSSFCAVKLLQQHEVTRQHSSGPKGRHAAVPLMGLGKAVSRKQNYAVKKPRSKIKSLSRADLIDPDTTDWTNVYDAARSYNPSVIPLPIRMGRPRANKLGDVPPNDSGNVELLKIPNFFHLTPPAIKKHCEVLREYCTPWPDNLPSRPIRITTINYVYSGPSIRHPESRKVKLQVYLKDLDLDAHARRKLILLVNDRYNKHNDELTIIADRCPTRKQNKDYAYYLLTALYHESWKTESWEEEAGDKTDEQLAGEIAQVQVELDPRAVAEKKRHRRHYGIINDKLVRFNKVGYPFVYEMRKYGLAGGLDSEEIKQAKEKWANLQKDQEDQSTFDPLYQRSSESEFKN
ncbi:28S ribosomal protein S35, mitochondrial-like [Hydractinia symbiolongicarpus]|uniref:28S ribosomal protein S35, mitochondrial-like n=1 Tax=Hydractinia symbiolongicarpus TaxID=13093 RepID=UPI00254E71B1|nr:28S ribosomal protein S35, mitochondrial-like [Hydractinia symbiolongicarpus]